MPVLSVNTISLCCWVQVLRNKAAALLVIPTLASRSLLIRPPHLTLHCHKHRSMAMAAIARLTTLLLFLVVLLITTTRNTCYRAKFAAMVLQNSARIKFTVHSLPYQQAG